VAPRREAQLCVEYERERERFRELLRSQSEGCIALMLELGLRQPSEVA
jgi:hypothetical protein